MAKPIAKVLEVHDDGNDLLRVVGEVGGEPAVAFGWVSATTNHFDPHRGEHRPDSAKPREMTAAEIRKYARGLLVEQNPPAPKSRRIL